jgi:CheY-like chemotaxis protein
VACAGPAVLIVDDEFGLAEMLREMLRERGYDVTLAINGRIALDLLHNRRVDVVITDLMMPVMDGAELATAIRASAVHGALPLVLMTSLPSAVPPRRELYDAVLTKPFTPDALLTTLDTILAPRADEHHAG